MPKLPTLSKSSAFHNVFDLDQRQLPTRWFTLYQQRIGIARSSVESNDSRVIHSTTPFSP